MQNVTSTVQNATNVKMTMQRCSFLNYISVYSLCSSHKLMKARAVKPLHRPMNIINNLLFV